MYRSFLWVNTSTNDVRLNWCTSGYRALVSILFWQRETLKLTKHRQRGLNMLVNVYVCLTKAFGSEEIDNRFMNVGSVRWTFRLSGWTCSNHSSLINQNFLLIEANFLDFLLSYQRLLSAVIVGNRYWWWNISKIIRLSSRMIHSFDAC